LIDVDVRVVVGVETGVVSLKNLEEIRAASIAYIAESIAFFLVITRT
jgi:hypothetical protein